MSKGGFWACRRILVTGHTGFKGAWLSAMLTRLGAQVTGFALDPPTEPSLFGEARLDSRLRDLRGDIRDAAALAQALRAARPEIVIHMAAQSLVRASYAEPVSTYATNVTGTINLMEATRHSPDLRVVIVVTSDKCYEQGAGALPFREGDALGGHDPYSSSKACAELVAQSWYKSFLAEQGIAVATARAGNVIGGGDHAADRIIPDAIRAFAAGRTLQVRHPQAVRPWQHVIEPLTGYLALAERAFEEPGQFSGAWNFGPGADHEKSVETLLAEAVSIWGGDARWEQAQGRHPHEASVLRLDASKARERLGWHCRLDFNATIARTIEFYRAVQDGGDAAAVLDAQIEAYFSAAQHEQAACALS